MRAIPLSFVPHAQMVRNWLPGHWIPEQSGDDQSVVRPGNSEYYATRGFLTSPFFQGGCRIASGTLERFCTFTPMFGSELAKEWFMNQGGTLSMGVRVT